MPKLMRVLRDLFMGPGNRWWCAGRFWSGLSFLAVFAAAGWNAAIGQPIDLGPGGLPGGLAALATAVAAFIFAKDRSHPGQAGSGQKEE